MVRAEPQSSSVLKSSSAAHCSSEAPTIIRTPQVVSSSAMVLYRLQYNYTATARCTASHDYQAAFGPGHISSSHPGNGRFSL